MLDAKRAAAGADAIPDLVIVTEEQPARRAFALMRDLGVSQVVVAVTDELPLAVKEVSGALSELTLMDQRVPRPGACSTARSAR